MTPNIKPNHCLCEWCCPQKFTGDETIAGINKSCIISDCKHDTRALAKQTEVIIQPDGCPINPCPNDNGYIVIGSCLECWEKHNPSAIKRIPQTVIQVAQQAPSDTDTATTMTDDFLKLVSHNQQAPAESPEEDSFIIYRSEWQSLESMLDDCGCEDGLRILYQILTAERDTKEHDAALIAQEREKWERGLARVPHEQKEGECTFGQSYGKCGDYQTCEECMEKEPPWLEQHDAAIAAQAREGVLDEIIAFASKHAQKPFTAGMLGEKIAEMRSPSHHGGERDHDVICNKIYPRPKKQERDP